MELPSGEVGKAPASTDVPAKRSGETKLQLPIEILLQIVHCIAPMHSRALIPVHHSSTQTLLSLARVSKAFYVEATKLLRRHCMFLNTSRRLADLLLCIEWQKSICPNQSFRPEHGAGLLLRNLSSLYLAPFQRSLDDLPVAVWTCEMLFEVALTLRRLVVKMPFASLPPENDHLGVQRRLQEGLASLKQLEEFVCVDYAGEEHELGGVWRNWPRLRRLALFGVPLGKPSIWQALAGLEALEEVVLARAQDLDVVNIKEEYFGALAERLAGDAGGGGGLDGRVRLMLMDVMYDVRDVRTADWAKADGGNRMTVEVYEVPTSFYGDESAEEAVAAWFRMGALDGRLWDWRGGVVG